MNANVVMQVATTKQFGDMEIQVYENPAVDHTRAQDDFWMTREQVGTALGYKNPSISIGTIHKRNAARLDPLSGLINLITPGGNSKPTYIICVVSWRSAVTALNPKRMLSLISAGM